MHDQRLKGKSKSCKTCVVAQILWNSWTLCEISSQRHPALYSNMWTTQTSKCCIQHWRTMIFVTTSMSYSRWVFQSSYEGSRTLWFYPGTVSGLWWGSGSMQTSHRMSYKLCRQYSYWHNSSFPLKEAWLLTMTLCASRIMCTCYFVYQLDASFWINLARC